jgi:isochorismate pyruvate lyase
MSVEPMPGHGVPDPEPGAAADAAPIAASNAARLAAPVTPPAAEPYAEPVAEPFAEPVAEPAPGSLAEVRAAIDRLDDRIVPLLVARSRHVLAAAGFKRSAAEVHAPQRAAAVVAKARGRAEAAGAPAAVVAVVERVYRELIAAGTEAELAQWQRDPPAPGAPADGAPTQAGEQS